MFSIINRDNFVPRIIEDGGYYGYGDPDRFNLNSKDFKKKKR